ncbi:MAG: tetratricopeptide repeat protein [Proteobacteria bacterium]|nr:tetratricopeptide repeat protein [Pseudomonadota bacterium]
MTGKGKFPGVVLLSALLAACTAAIPLTQTSNDDRDRLLSGAALPAHIQIGISQPDDDVLGLSADMIRFVDQVTAHAGTDSGKIDALLRALILSPEMNFVFDPAATYTAAQTFEHGRANCLAFAGMVTVMLRHLGIRAEFNEVDVPEVWDMRSPKTMVLYKHVNVMIRPRGGRKKIADLDLAEYDDSYRQRIISDDQAVAQYYNNRAMAYLFDENVADAFSYLVKAIELDPQASYLWANLGSLYRRTGNREAAELSYQTALSEKRGDLIAISNLARLYSNDGKMDLARKLDKRAEYFRSRNPYFRYRQGMDAFSEQDFGVAMRHTKAAIRMYSKEHRFHFLLGAIYQKIGNAKKAEASMLKAVEMSTDANQKARYRSKMDHLLSSR